MLKFFKAVSVFESGASAAQIFGSIIWLLLVGGSGTVTGWLAKNAPIIAQFGPVAWVAAGLLAGIVVAVILAIMQWANRQVRYGEYLTALSATTSQINPLGLTFENQIIKIADLYLPEQILHKNKRFDNCKFVGPGAIAFLGGHLERNGFQGCGDVITVNDANITGIPVLDGCTITNCSFIRVTCVADKGTARGMKEAGFPVSGLDN